MFKRISLHPRLVAGLDVLLNILMLWWITGVKSWWVLLLIFFLRQFVWLVFIRLMYYPMEAIKWRHYLSLFLFNLGILFFLIFTERSADTFVLHVSWYLIAFLFLLVVFLSFYFLPTSKISLVAFQKPHMRWRFIMSVIGLAGVFTGMTAIIFFQIAYRLTNWVWYVGAAFIATAVAGWWWWEYGLKYTQKFLVYLITCFILILELIWVVVKLPFGHLISGLTLIWIWYLLWLLMRFSLTSQGIKWKKQIKFLSVNSILFILFLIFAVRWK